jgi:GT2 family glycosyltransferase
MIDIALATKNRNELFKKTLDNLNSQSISKKFSLFIMNGNENDEIKEFVNSKKWNFKKIEIYKDNEINKIKKNKGNWPIIYNYLFQKGNSNYLTYWSDDILLKDKKAFEKAINRLKKTSKKTATGVFPFYSPTHGKNPYLMVSEIGIIMINFGIIKREIFEKVKGLDEKFKFFCADRDLSNKIYEKGYKTIINSDIIVSHIDLKKEWRNPLSKEEETKKARKRIESKWKKIQKQLINYESIAGLFTSKKFFTTNKIKNNLEIIKFSNSGKRINFTKEKFHIKKPKNNIKEFPKKLPGTFWGITTFFNPARYKNKYQNYKIFRKESKKQGLKLCAVEIEFGKKPFELTKKDAERLIQIRGNKKNIMWQKERMMNVALENLPKDCDKVAWLDCDIIFENKNWIEETSKLLNKYKIIQPFENCAWLPRGRKRIEIETLPEGLLTSNKIKSRAYNYLHKKISELKTYGQAGHLGFAWAARKTIFNKLKFYDKAITGSGDLFLTDAFYNKKMNFLYDPIPKKMKQDYLIWKKKTYKEIKSSVSYTPGNLFHLWHGEPKDRRYFDRHLILKESKFNPEKDIKVGKNKLFEWSSKKPRLHKDIEKYFFIRNEEGKKEPIRIKIKNLILTFKKKSSLGYHKTMGKIGKTIYKINPTLYQKLKTPKDKIESKLK